MKNTSKNEILKKVSKVKEFFNSGKTKDIKFRKSQLISLLKTIKRYEKDIFLALKKDLNKSNMETFITEVAIVKEELDYMIKNIPNFSKEKDLKTSLSQMPGNLKSIYEPYGVALIISPWNYPFQLNFVPLVDAISAGNTVILKPSSRTPETTKVIIKICKEAFNEGLVEVVIGGKNETHQLIDSNLDYIFFTGSTEVGRDIMEKASKHLTPVTLELGGKSPTIVDDSINIEMAAKRIVFGKLVNAGQTCIAPDYIYVKSNIKEKLIREIINEIEKALPNEEYINENYPKLIDKDHLKKVQGYLKNQRVLIPKKFKKNVIISNTNQMLPVLVDEPTWDSPLMTNEIFGPILPIISWKKEDEMINKLKSLEKPLALYIFSSKESFIEKVLENISSGGVTINDTLLHISSNNAPFGGVGNSGMGNYHGEAGFITFSHEKTVLKKSKKLDNPLRYHPYKKLDEKIVKKLLG